MGGILISEAALVLVLRGLDALALRAGISPAESRASLAWVSLVADRKTLVESTNFQLLAVAVVGMVFAALLGRRGMWRRAVILALLSIATLLALRGTGPLIDLTLGARPL